MPFNPNKNNDLKQASEAQKLYRAPAPAKKPKKLIKFIMALVVIFALIITSYFTISYVKENILNGSGKNPVVNAQGDLQVQEIELVNKVEKQK